MTGFKVEFRRENAPKFSDGRGLFSFGIVLHERFQLRKFSYRSVRRGAAIERPRSNRAIESGAFNAISRA